MSDYDQPLRDTSGPADADIDVRQHIDPVGEEHDAETSRPAGRDPDTSSAMDTGTYSHRQSADPAQGAEIDVARGMTGFQGAGSPAVGNQWEEE